MDTRWCDSKDAGLRGEDCEISHRLEKGTSASDDAGPRGWSGLWSPTLIGEGNECQRGRWPRGGGAL